MARHDASLPVAASDAARARRNFDLLEGEWRLRRRIRDLSRLTDDGHLGLDDALPGAMNARLQGYALFERMDPQTLFYREAGTLILENGRQVHAERRYLYRLDGAAWRIEFADGPSAGNLFLWLDPSGGALLESDIAMLPDRPRPDVVQMADNHLCGRDLYQAVYRLAGFDVRRGEPRSAPRIIQHTVVNGPKKDYSIVSMLRR